jgi:hypothetical protein
MILFINVKMKKNKHKMTERQYNRIIRDIRMGNIYWVNGLLV